MCERTWPLGAPLDEGACEQKESSPRRRRLFPWNDMTVCGGAGKSDIAEPSKRRIFTFHIEPVCRDGAPGEPQGLPMRVRVRGGIALGRGLADQRRPRSSREQANEVVPVHRNRPSVVAAPRALPSTRPRQLSMALDSGMSPTERRTALAQLALILMEAACGVTGERSDDER
jgi:hypothetical protein